MSHLVATASNLEDLILDLEAFLTAQGHAHGKRFVGTGSGDLINYAGKAGTVAQTVTCTATSATSFDVVGSVSGALGTATVGTPFTSAQVDFTITAGGTAYVAGDVWTINLSPAWALTRAFNGCWRPDVLNLSLGFYTHGGAPHNAQIRAIRAFECREVTMRTNQSESWSPSAFTVDWSDDGSSWTTAQSYSGVTTGWSTSLVRRFSVAAAGAHRWWRIQMTAYNSTALAYDSLDFYDAAGSDNGYGARYPFLVVEAQGNDGNAQSLFFAIQGVDVPGSDIYGLSILHHTSFDSLAQAANQPGRDGNFVELPLANLPMNYWAVANGRRFMLGVKVSTVYVGGYFGLMLPYIRPSAYPLPLFMGGSVNGVTSIRWSSTSLDQIGYFGRSSANYPTAWVRDVSGVWRTIATHASDAQSFGSNGRLYPNFHTAGIPSSNFYRENIGGGYPLIPFIPIFVGQGPQGELDGAFWTTGFGQAAESVIRHNRFDHVVFQNIYRTTAGDYWAMRLD